MAKNIEDQDTVIKFIRTRDYTHVKPLGQGGCGKTILLHDPQIDEFFVCKKYSPCDEEQRQTLFVNFVREIKLLHKIHHPNLVRVFNYYLYPDKFTGYILMEYIDGTDIDGYLEKFPEQINDVFMQTISGFTYLERTGILHRDIRLGNIMVHGDGTVKIIDFGFGKAIHNSKDYEKSISLNWWCPLPDEFQEERYDFGTEVYFVGKLFEDIIKRIGINHFQHIDLLRKMCQTNPQTRIHNFAEIEKNVGNKHFFEIDFTDDEKESYRLFVNAICQHINKIDNDTKYVIDTGRIQAQLTKQYDNFMLEKYVPDSSLVIRCFLSGNYYYNRKHKISVEIVKSFLQLLKSSTEEKKRIILSNLYTRLDSLPHYSEQNDFKDGDIPF